MTFDKAYVKFKLLTGLDENDASQWFSLLEEANAYIESIVTKKDLSKSEILRLENAVAVYAYYLYVSCTSVEYKSFKAGDLSVTYNTDKAKIAKEMWERELNSISDIAKTGFIFKRVT